MDMVFQLPETTWIGGNVRFIVIFTVAGVVDYNPNLNCIFLNNIILQVCVERFASQIP